MSAYQIFAFSSQQALDTAASVVSGATLTFSLTGTGTPANAYSDSALTTPVSNPLSADAAGVFIPVFLDPSVVYRVVLKTQTGAVLKTWDPANEAVLTTASFSALYFLTDDHKITAAELAAGVTPVNYAYAPGALRRYGADPTGVADSHTALLNACKCNSDVFDDYPGGGTYLFNSETVLPNYPIKIRGQTRGQISNSVGNVGSIFKLATAAGAGAACLRTNAVTVGVNIQDIGFAFQTLNSGQIGVRFTNDLRNSSIFRCEFIGGGAAGTTVIGIQFDGATVFTGDVVIQGCFFNGLIKGIYLQGACTTVKIQGNEFYGYVGGSAAGSAIQMDSPVGGTVFIVSNYFEGWANGIFGNVVSLIVQGFNSYAICTNSFNWAAGSTKNQSFGEVLLGGAGVPIYTKTEAAAHLVWGMPDTFVAGGTLQATRGFQEGQTGTTLRPYNAGYPQAVTFAAGNFTGNGSMTWTVAGGGQVVFQYAIIGKTLTVWFNISGTVAGTPSTAVQIAIPGGFAASSVASIGTCQVLNNGVTSVTACQVNALGTVIQVFTTPAGSGNFTAGTVQVTGQIQIQTS